MTTLRITYALVLTLLMALPVTVPAAPVTQDQPTAWDTTREKTAQAADWTAEKSKDAWQATKRGTSEAAHWTADKAKQGWQATKEGADKAAHWTAEKSKDAWQATKEGASRSAAWVKAETTSDDKASAPAPVEDGTRKQ